jgi:hypothetical protein
VATTQEGRFEALVDSPARAKNRGVQTDLLQTDVARVEVDTVHELADIAWSPKTPDRHVCTKGPAFRRDTMTADTILQAPCEVANPVLTIPDADCDDARALGTRERQHLAAARHDLIGCASSVSE